MPLLFVADAADDNVTMTDAQIANNGVVLVNYSNAAHFGFNLGGGLNNLLLDNVTLNLDRDNAFSAGTNVTVSGGALNFNGHATAMGNPRCHRQCAGCRDEYPEYRHDGYQRHAERRFDHRRHVNDWRRNADTQPRSIRRQRQQGDRGRSPGRRGEQPEPGPDRFGTVIAGLTMEDGADWYKFRMDAAGTAADFVRIDFANAQGNLDMVVYGADGTTVVGSSTGTGNSEIVSLSGVPAGNYYVKVYGYQGATNPNYTLDPFRPFFPIATRTTTARRSWTARPEGGANSPNLGPIGSSGRIISGLTMEDGADWYKFQMDAAGTAADVVRIDFANAQGNLDLVVYRADGTTVVGSSTGTGDSEIVNLNGSPAGYYYVKVYGDHGATNPKLHLVHRTHFSRRLRGKRQPRRSWTARPEGGANSPNLGLINSKRIISRPDDGRRRRLVQIPDGRRGRLRSDFVQIDFVNGQGNLDLVVYGADGTTVVGSSTGTGNSEIVSLNGAPAGYYYVKVYGYSGGDESGLRLDLLPPFSRCLRGQRQQGDRGRLARKAERTARTWARSSRNGSSPA